MTIVESSTKTCLWIDYGCQNADVSLWIDYGCQNAEDVSLGIAGDRGCDASSRVRTMQRGACCFIWKGHCLTCCNSCKWICLLADMQYC